MARTYKIKRNKVDEVTRMARAIMPVEQARRDDFVIVDVSNKTDADHRASVRSKETRTVRRLTKIEKLAKAGVIDKIEASACEWYAATHAARYDTLGITANYGDGGGTRRTNFDHLPKTREQLAAYLHFSDARQSITPAFLGLFERVVIHGRPMGRLVLAFRTAARQVADAIQSVGA